MDCLIIDSYNNNIDEKLLYSILNQSKQLENYILINTITSINNKKFILNDLKSRIESFLFIGIDLPTDDLLKVIISKTLSEKQIKSAASDTEHLFEIRTKLINMLEREKRINLFKKTMEVIPILVDMEIAGYKLSTFEH